MASRNSDNSKSGCFAKTKLCRFHILGLCRRGEECHFAHNPEEMCRPPDFTRTKLCKALRETGECEDKNCSFAHSADELRSLKAQMFTKTKMCHFYVMGHCSMGTKCNFAHTPLELQEPRPAEVSNHASPVFHQEIPAANHRSQRSPPLSPAVNMQAVASPMLSASSMPGSPEFAPSLPVALADILEAPVTASQRASVPKYGASKPKPKSCLKNSLGDINEHCSLPKPVGLVPGSGRNSEADAVNAMDEAPSAGLKVPMPMTITDSPIYLFQADPRRPGSFQAVGSNDPSQQSEVLIGQIRESLPDDILAPGSPIKGKESPGKGRTIKLPPNDGQGNSSKGNPKVKATAKSFRESVSATVAQDGADGDPQWQVKNTFLAFEPPVKPIRLVRTAEGSLCSLVNQLEED